MTATGTRIVAVRSALVAALTPLFTSYVAEERVEVSYQWLPKSSARNRIFTRRARYTTEPASMRAGRNFRDETGRFELVVLVEGVGQTAEWSGQHAVDLGRLCEVFVADRKNNELGVEGMQTLVMEGDGELGEMFADGGTLAEVTYPIRYTARIQ